MSYSHARQGRGLSHLNNSSLLSHYHRVAGNLTRPRQRRRDMKKSIRRKNFRTSRDSVRAYKNVPWLPADDYLLINSVIMVCNLTEVYHTVRFAYSYTEKEIEMRWMSLLFDPLVSRTALKAIANLPPFLKAQIDRQIPFSSREDSIISQVKFSDVFPNGKPKSMGLSDLQSSIFTKLLRQYPTTFYTGRDELDLYRQWNRFNSLHCIAEGIKPSEELSVKNPHLVHSDSKTEYPAHLNTRYNFIGESATSSDQAPSPLGGDPTSFSDTELLMEETVSSALTAGIPKLTEPSTVARRKRLLSETSYHGFQGLVTETVLDALMKDSSNSSTSQHDLTASQSFSIPSGPRTSLSVPSGSCSRSMGDRNPNISKNFHSNLRPFCGSSSNATSYAFQRRLELHRYKGRLWARLRRTKEEARRWTRLVEARVAMSISVDVCQPFFDSQPIYPALATLSGKRKQFVIIQKEVIFGRNSTIYQPDIDLSDEGDSSRVSRCHGRIRLMSDGVFWLANFSSHPVFVDGNPILSDEEVELKNFATVCISHLVFRFDVNQPYVTWLCRAEISGEDGSAKNEQNALWQSSTDPKPE